jgi:hypothetical protein
MMSSPVDAGRPVTGHVIMMVRMSVLRIWEHETLANLERRAVLHNLLAVSFVETKAAPCHAAGRGPNRSRPDHRVRPGGLQCSR